MTSEKIAPSIYVGTYAKYAAGSIKGAWIPLESHDKESFYAACRELHKDERDPELMFQDFEGFPHEFYGECCLQDQLWEWIELDEHEKKITELYLKMEGIDYYNKDTALEQYRGAYDSEKEFAEETIRETGEIPDNLPSFLESCIDWQAVWDSYLRYDYIGIRDDDNVIHFYAMN